MDVLIRLSAPDPIGYEQCHGAKGCATQNGRPWEGLSLPVRIHWSVHCFRRSLVDVNLSIGVSIVIFSRSCGKRLDCSQTNLLVPLDIALAVHLPRHAGRNGSDLDLNRVFAGLDVSSTSRLERVGENLFDLGPWS